MTDSVTIEVPGEPVPWKRPGRSKSGHRYTKAECVRHSELIKKCWLLAGRPSFGTKPVAVSAIFYLGPKQRVPDTDNLLKLALDALEKCVYDNDRQVVCFSGVHRLRSEQPRTKLTIWEAHSASEWPPDGEAAAA